MKRKVPRLEVCSSELENFENQLIPFLKQKYKDIFGRRKSKQALFDKYLTVQLFSSNLKSLDFQTRTFATKEINTKPVQGSNSI